MADGGRKTGPRTLLLGAALAAGLLAGLGGVYFIASGDGNQAAGGTDCGAALAAAKRIAPLATGEVAAFRVADASDSLADLAFQTPDGKDTTLAAFAGKHLLVNLWATWCVPCRSEMPTLDRLEADLGGDSFQVVAVNIDRSDPERAKAFLDEVGASNIAFYSDPSSGVFTQLRSRALARGLPTTLLVDDSGCRIGVLEGPAEWDSEDAKALIRAAIESPPAG